MAQAANVGHIQAPEDYIVPASVYFTHCTRDLKTLPRAIPIFLCTGRCYERDGRWGSAERAMIASALLC